MLYGNNNIITYNIAYYYYYVSGVYIIIISIGLGYNIASCMHLNIIIKLYYTYYTTYYTCACPDHNVIIYY